MNPYIGEIRLVPFNFAPVGWSFCNGQLLPIDQFVALFDLIGTTYGGDGVNTFALPNLQSRTVCGVGGQFVQGQLFGEEVVTLSTAQIPAHAHQIAAADVATSYSPANGFPANAPRNIYASVPTTTLAGDTIAANGGSQPHNNMQPYLVLNYIIALEGIFPSQN